MKLGNLRDLYLQELKDIYSAESQVMKALPKMVKAASSPKLQDAFREHLEQTRNQISRLDQIFQGLGVPTRGRRCEAMEGIIKEGEEMMTIDAEPSVRDAALIASAQKVEHYEMASYGTVKAYAKMLGEDEAVDLLDETLSEEMKTDKMLTKLAEKAVNKEAIAGH